MNPLTTPEVLRLLEGGNESPLAKFNLRLAIHAASLIPGAFCETRFMGKWVEVTPLGLLINLEVNGRVLLKSEVVTRELGPIKCGVCMGFRGDESGPCEPCGASGKAARPAIVISTK